MQRRFKVGGLQCRDASLQIRRLFHDTRGYQEDSRWPGWQVIVGIETHAQIKSRQKLFSGMIAVCAVVVVLISTGADSFTSDIGEPPNTRVSLFDAAFPGTLPVDTQILAEKILILTVKKK